MKKFLKLLSFVIIFFYYIYSIIIEEEKVREEITVKKKYKYYYQTMLDWMKKIQQNQSLNDYFKQNKIRKIAIYGAGTLCDILYQEIKKQEQIKIIYIIDKNPKESYYKYNKTIPIVSLDNFNNLEKIDLLIVTPIAEYVNIESKFEKGKNVSLITSLETLINCYK